VAKRRLPGLYPNQWISIARLNISTKWVSPTEYEPVNGGDIMVMKV
jgi:hypothetical protein